MGRCPAKRLIFLLLGLLTTGCASIQPASTHNLHPGETVFEPVGIIDFREHTLDDYRELVQPGDLIINYMRLGRAAKKREWLFTILPYGHSMLVVDPDDPQGILECRFHGIRSVGPEELKLYSYNLVYRLRDPSRLNVDRLKEFACLAQSKETRYSFAGWLGRNQNLFPELPSQIGTRYTCSTMVVAAYHYSGVTLSACDPPNRVITPVSIAASKGVWNQYSVPLPSVASSEKPAPLH